MTRSPSSSSFSLEAYQRAKQRLSELAGTKTQPLAQGGDDTSDKPHKGTRKRPNNATTPRVNHRSNNDDQHQEEDEGREGLLSLASDLDEGSEGEEEGEFELSQMEKKLLVSIKTAGMRPAREHALLEAAQELSRHRKDMMGRARAEGQRWRCRARSMVRRLQGRVTRQVEEIRAAELVAEEMREEMEKRIKRVMDDAEAKIHAGRASAKEEVEGERKRLEEQSLVDRKRYEDEILADMEEKMVRDLERTKNRLKRESKAKVDGVISRLEEEFHESMAIHDAALRKAMLNEAEALSRAERLEEEKTDLECRLQKEEESNKELVKAVAQLRSRLAQQEGMQRKTEGKIKELESCFQEVVDGLKSQAEEAHKVHQQDRAAWQDKRKQELEQVDQLVRAKMAAKDQVITRLKEDLILAQKEAGAARAMIREIQQGFREV